jgi:hypothetical protein
MLPATRSGSVEPLVHMIPTTVTGNEVQLVLRVTVDADGIGSAVERHAAVRTVLPEAPTFDGHAVPITERAGTGDLVEFCADLSRSVGDDDLTQAMAVVATLAGCPTVLMRPDRSVLAAGAPRGPDGKANTDLSPQQWRWAANGPRADREIAICAGTHRLGVVAFQRPVPDLPGPASGIVHDLLALALLGRDARRRAEAAELQATLFACLSDEHWDSQVGSTEQVAYRPAVISPIADTPWSPAMFARLHQRIGDQPMLAAGRCARVQDRSVCLYPQPPDSDPRGHAEAWRQVLAPLHCRVAVGMASLRGSDLRESYRTARSLADLQASSTPGLSVDDVAVVDELGVVGGALGPGWGPRLGHFIRRVLGDLVNSPRFGGEMVDTLHAYLVCGGSPTEAARMLHLSASSMKYRMRIIRESLGDRLHDHDSVFEIELALRLLKAFEGCGTAVGDTIPTGTGPGVKILTRH